MRRNPLFIRSIIPTKWMKNLVNYINNLVAIPYSSGQSFLRIENEEGIWSWGKVAIPYSSGQSFLHFVTHFSSFAFLKCRNPLFIRSIIPTHHLPIWFIQCNRMSQSLIHQVNHSYSIALVVVHSSEEVAIPYSSGQSFLQIILFLHVPVFICRNPLFIRSIIPTVTKWLNHL